MHPVSDETIAAIATPVGRGGIGVVRVSGTLVAAIAQALLGGLPKARYASYRDFKDSQDETIDQGIALYFPAPNSFTGEDVLELQGHGGVVVMDRLLQTILEYGARLARPGEFSERAFLNGKIDLTQAEAIADLIDSASVQAARCALRSLQGEFSTHIHSLVDALIWLRTYIEAGIDFVDEEIDLLADGLVINKINELQQAVARVLDKAQQGYLLREGLRVVLVGEPNVGKSSLLNSLSGRDSAIVTPIAGTTRDVIHEHIQLDGIPLHITDTAGLRETEDVVEQEGIRRTRIALQEADIVILLLDDRYDNDVPQQALLAEMPTPPVIIRNKIDLSGHEAGINMQGVVYLSAKTGAGVAKLKQYLKDKVGVHDYSEGNFIARRRHLDALQRAQQALNNAEIRTLAYQNELLAEELRLAQQALGEITGEFTADDLLGKIFSTFCVGK
ncbi:MAG: tRNA uridine-5-carboxymethylaminomethyl(34) synthesis GTPase MnmE [Thiotrichaceae bacterium]|nr:tRNA uridine-5-carboxymethylaminomethyl(34) synthesis GTPase MnmE [Thiotrichaceae bacterium]